MSMIKSGGGGEKSPGSGGSGGRSDPILVKAFIRASAWVGNSAPFIQRVHIPEIADISLVWIAPHISANIDEINEYHDLNLHNWVVGNGFFEVRAFGKLNSLDIPISVAYFYSLDTSVSGIELIPNGSVSLSLYSSDSFPLTAFTVPRNTAGEIVFSINDSPAAGLENPIAFPDKGLAMAMCRLRSIGSAVITAALKSNSNIFSQCVFWLCDLKLSDHLLNLQLFSDCIVTVTTYPLDLPFNSVDVYDFNTNVVNIENVLINDNKTLFKVVGVGYGETDIFFRLKIGAVGAACHVVVSDKP